MTKRRFAGVLWLLVGWTLGSMLTIGYGLPGVVAPLLGGALAAFVVWDPTGRIWSPGDGSEGPQRASSRPQPVVRQAG